MCLIPVRLLLPPSLLQPTLVTRSLGRLENMLLTDLAMFSFNYPNGEPQTPTRTPTAAVFGDSAFQTPKLESSFFDPRVTWDTSDPYASSPEFLRTPRRFSLGHPPKLPDASGRNPIDHVPNLKGARFARQTDPVKRFRSSKPNEEGLRTVESAKSAASMQTPPPSSASTNKVSGFGSLNDSRKRQSTSNAPGDHLETPSRLMGASPRLLANLQSSPDLFQLASIDPSASPFLPQQKLFCDQDLDHQESDVSLPEPNVDSFDPNAAADVFNDHLPMQDLHFSQLPVIDGSTDLPEFNSTRLGLSSASDAAPFPAPFSTSPRLPIPKAEDPAMFLSSPARRFGGTQLTPKRPLTRPTRQPYHHQTEESKREELHRAQFMGRQLPGPFLEDEDDDVYTPRQRPGLARSSTHTAVTRLSQRPGSSPAGWMASTSRIRKSPSKGRSSPVKTLRPQSARASSGASGLPTRSQSMVLKIGKDGRAKTEMRTVPESPTGLTDPIAGIEFEGSTTGSEYDSAEYSEYPAVGQNPPFAFSEAGRPMANRSDSGSRPHSKGSYASSIASSHSGRASPWAASSRGGVRRPPHDPSPDHWRRTPNRPSVLPNPNLTYPSGYSGSEVFAEPEEDTGDAQHALRQVLKQRSRRPRPYSIGYGAQPSRAAPSAHFRSSPPRFGSDFDLHPREANASPTTVTDPDLATPTTDRYSNPSNGTRCICNSMDNGGHLMIQWYVVSYSPFVANPTVNRAIIGYTRDVSGSSDRTSRRSMSASSVHKRQRRKAAPAVQSVARGMRQRRH